MFHTLRIQRLSFVLIILQVTLTFICGMEFCYSTTTSQPSCKVITTQQVCKHLARIGTTLLQPYKVVARLLQPSQHCKGWIAMRSSVMYSNNFEIYSFCCTIGHVRIYVVYTYMYIKNSFKKIMILKRGVGIYHCYKK